MFVYLKLIEAENEKNLVVHLNRIKEMKLSEKFDRSSPDQFIDLTR